MPETTVVTPPGVGADARQALQQIAGRRTAPIPTELLINHILALPGGWDWPVRRAAFEALLRRLTSARSQKLNVARAPGQGPWGRYVLGRPDFESPLPYDVRLTSLVPLQGSCDCADYVRASLGLCKHLLAVLSELAGRSGAFQQMLREPGRRLAVRPRLVWDASLVPAGPADSLEALGLVIPAATGSGRDRRKVPPALARLFRASRSGPGLLVTTHADDPGLRQRLVETIAQSARAARVALDPAARAVLTEERVALERVLRLRAAAPRLRREIGRTRRRLYAYQKEGVRRFLDQGRLVLADDMGLGKTTQAIVAASALYAAGLVRRGLLVVPASLKPQWEREWRAVSDVPLQVVEGGADARRTLYQKTRQGFLVTNYEQVVRDIDDGTVAAWAPELIVLDEAQRIKNWATRTALTIKRLKPEFRLVLTGTPMENRLEELASIVEWVDDRALEPKWRLLPWHSVSADGKREVVGARNLDSLRARLAPVLLRRVRTEVLAQLPTRQDTVIPVDLTSEQREAHDDLMQPIAKLASTARHRPLTQAEFLRLMSLLLTQRVIANGMAQLNFESTWPAIRNRRPTPALIQSLGAPKLLELRELVANLVLTQNRKVVIFSQWRRMLELGDWAVSDLLAAEGRRSLFFTGREGPRRRTQNLVEFHDDPSAALLFLTDAGGVGLNLQRAANACINLELPWNPAVLEQRIGRIHRLGQRRPIDVFNLVSRACIEERIASLVADKRALFNGLFDGTTDELRFEGSGAFREVLTRLSDPAAVVVAATDEDERGEEAGEPNSEEIANGLEATMAVEAASAPDSPAPLVLSGPTDGRDEVAQLFQAITVQRGADGSVRIDAPPHAARALTSLLAGMARLLGTINAGDTVSTSTESLTDRSSGSGAAPM